MPPTQTTMLRTCNNKVRFTRFPFRTGSKQSYLVKHELDRGEAPAVLRAGAVCLQCIEMGGGAVAHVLGKAGGGVGGGRAARGGGARGRGGGRGGGGRRRGGGARGRGGRTPRPRRAAGAGDERRSRRAAQ